MAPKLYLAELSPPVRSVLLTAEAIGLELERVPLDLLKKEQLSPEFLKLNPQHTVPTLVDDDGFVVWDSHAIMPYLVEKYAKDDSLYPKDIRQRATINQRLHFDTNSATIRGTGLRPIFYEGATEVPEKVLKYLDEYYDLLEKFLGDNDWIAGNSVTIADLSLITSVSISHVIAPIDESKYPKVIAWLARSENLPYYEVNRKGQEVLKQIILEKLSN